MARERGKTWKLGNSCKEAWGRKGGREKTGEKRRAGGCHGNGGHARACLPPLPSPAIDCLTIDY